MILLNIHTHTHNNTQIDTHTQIMLNKLSEGRKDGRMTHPHDYECDPLTHDSDGIDKGGNSFNASESVHPSFYPHTNISFKCERDDSEGARGVRQWRDGHTDTVTHFIEEKHTHVCESPEWRVTQETAQSKAHVCTDVCLCVAVDVDSRDAQSHTHTHTSKNTNTNTHTHTHTHNYGVPPTLKPHRKYRKIR
eukprot:GHVR01028671.1.p1 GENE.GHVR01028671.1~~GHVR01028671.1.p1  ORF type:complete len:192 (+),score=86.99 GHVR01028671.1:150-725(+)